MRVETITFAGYCIANECLYNYFAFNLYIGGLNEVYTKTEVCAYHIGVGTS